MRVVRAEAGIRFELSPIELQALADLLAELFTELESEVITDDEVHERLYPSAYEDLEAANAYRQMTETSLRNDRIDRTELCIEELSQAPLRPGGLTRRERHELLLDDAAGDRWLRVLNDLRLVLGTRLAVTEDAEPPGGLDPDDPEALAFVMYGWLTAVQDSLVRVLFDASP
jgi:hypothetical protein